MASTGLVVDPGTAGVSVLDHDPSISVLWDRAAQQAVIADRSGPTIASRAYAITHTAIFEAWAAYDPTAVGTAYGDALQQAASEITEANKAEAMSYAAFVALVDLFPGQKPVFEALMADLGHGTDLASAAASSAPAALGILAGEGVIAAHAADGSNQAAGYADTSGYVPANADPATAGEIENWTPEYVPIDSDAPIRLQSFLTPHWGEVEPFALPSGDALRPPPPVAFFAEAIDAELDMAAGTITLHGLAGEGTPKELKKDLKDLSKALKKHTKGTEDADETKQFLKDLKRGLKEDLKKAKSDDRDHCPDKHGDPEPLVLKVSKDLVGPVINSEFVAQAEQIESMSAALTVEHKVIAEFWEDGGGTSFPPGTWMTFGEYISARDDNTLDQDAQMFFALGNAVFDAGIATWAAKVHYDYARPVAAIRDLGALGLIGEWGTDDQGNEGYLIDAYAGPGLGTRTILAEEFLTYQRPMDDPSPPFAEYTSGHSSFSAAAAAVLTAFTGSDHFGASVAVDRLMFDGVVLDEPLVMQWETFQDAADASGISRLYGGIHFDDGDRNGRVLGAEVGDAVHVEAMSYVDGTAEAFFFG